MTENPYATPEAEAKKTGRPGRPTGHLIAAWLLGIGGLVIVVFGCFAIALFVASPASSRPPVGIETLSTFSIIFAWGISWIVSSAWWWKGKVRSAVYSALLGPIIAAIVIQVSNYFLY